MTRLKPILLLLSLVCAFASPAAENIKSVAGVAKANLKAVGAVAEANIKAIGSVDNTAGGSSTLNDGLTAYWKLDEASGTRVDSGANGQDLTESGGTVAGASAKINNGTDFEVTTDTAQLKRADSATLSLGSDTDFTFAVWVQRESAPTFPFVIIDKAGSLTAGADTEYRIEIETGSGQNYYSFVVGNGSSSARVSATTHGPASTSALELVVAWHNSATDTINIQINNGTVDSQAWSGGTQDGGNAFSIGSFGDNAAVRMDGLLDEIPFWKRVLTTDERTELFNSGSGKTYPF